MRTNHFPPFHPLSKHFLLHHSYAAWASSGCIPAPLILSRSKSSSLPPVLSSFKTQLHQILTTSNFLPQAPPQASEPSLWISWLFLGFRWLHQHVLFFWLHLGQISRLVLSWSSCPPAVLQASCCMYFQTVTMFLFGYF